MYSYNALSCYAIPPQAQLRTKIGWHLKRRIACAWCFYSSTRTRSSYRVYCVVICSMFKIETLEYNQNSGCHRIIISPLLPRRTSLCLVVRSGKIGPNLGRLWDWDILILTMCLTWDIVPASVEGLHSVNCLLFKTDYGAITVSLDYNHHLSWP